MILFAASFKIPSKNDRPLFISISSNRQPDPCQSFSTPSSKTRFESNRRNTVQWFPASPPRISLNLVFLSCAPRTRARTQTHSYIRVWWPWLYLRRRKRRITLNLSPLLVISRDHETETKTRAGPEWLTFPPLPLRDIWHGFAAGSFRDPPTRENTRLNTVAVKSDMERWFEGRNSFLKKRRGWWGLIN